MRLKWLFFCGFGCGLVCYMPLAVGGARVQNEHFRGLHRTAALVVHH